MSCFIAFHRIIIPDWLLGYSIKTTCSMGNDEIILVPKTSTIAPITLIIHDCYPCCPLFSGKTKTNMEKKHHFYSMYLYFFEKTHGFITNQTLTTDPVARAPPYWPCQAPNSAPPSLEPVLRWRLGKGGDRKIHQLYSVFVCVYIYIYILIVHTQLTKKQHDLYIYNNL